jgi:hypothetical protein
LPDPSLLLNEIVNHLPGKQFDTKELEFKDLPRAYFKIYITHLPQELSGYKRWQYLNSNIGWSREISAEDLEKKVLLKKNKVKNYVKGLDEIILIIVADSSRNSGMLHLNNYGIDFSCEEFKQIFLVKYLLEIIKIG